MTDVQVWPLTVVSEYNDPDGNPHKFERTIDLEMLPDKDL